MNQNKMKITSFDAEETGCFGDVLSHAPEHRPLSVGMLGLGYFEYWNGRYRRIWIKQPDFLPGRCRNAK